jgi:hypothetical protein
MTLALANRIQALLCFPTTTDKKDCSAIILIDEVAGSLFLSITRDAPM